MSAADGWGELVRAVAVFSLLGMGLWALSRLTSRPDRRQPPEDEPEGTPYHVYDASSDRHVIAREAPALLEEEDRIAGIARLSGRDWQRRLGSVEAAAAALQPAFATAGTRLAAAFTENANRVALTLLIDHSGSMRDHMTQVAATVRWLSDWCDAAGVPLAVDGFTTLGWRGGAPRRGWIGAGRPVRPGRLCALLTLRYRDFAGPMDEADWQVMANRAVLRENVDGEAIDTAARELSDRPEPIRLLIVVSDGAPVDDSTLLENGSNFLVRHIRAVIGQVEGRGAVRLGAVGIRHRVDGYYARSVVASDASQLPMALAEIASVMLGQP